MFAISASKVNTVNTFPGRNEGKNNESFRLSGPGRCRLCCPGNRLISCWSWPARAWRTVETCCFTEDCSRHNTWNKYWQSRYDSVSTCLCISLSVTVLIILVMLALHTVKKKIINLSDDCWRTALSLVHRSRELLLQTQSDSELSKHRPVEEDSPGRPASAGSFHAAHQSPRGAACHGGPGGIHLPHLWYPLPSVSLRPPASSHHGGFSQAVPPLLLRVPCRPWRLCLFCRQWVHGADGWRLGLSGLFLEAGPPPRPSWCSFDNARWDREPPWGQRLPGEEGGWDGAELWCQR